MDKGLGAPLMCTVKYGFLRSVIVLEGCRTHVKGALM